MAKSTTTTKTAIICNDNLPTCLLANDMIFSPVKLKNKIAFLFLADKFLQIIPLICAQRANVPTWSMPMHRKLDECYTLIPFNSQCLYATSSRRSHKINRNKAFYSVYCPLEEQITIKISFQCDSSERHQLKYTLLYIYTWENVIERATDIYIRKCHIECVCLRVAQLCSLWR